MPASNIKEQLASLPIAADLSERMLNEISALAHLATFATGQFIFREGDVQRDLYLVARGHVVLEMCVPAGYCTRLLTIGPGEVLGWSALLGEGKMTASAICQDAVELIALNGPGLLAYCERDYEFGYLFMKHVAKALSRRLLGTRLQMLDLFGPPVAAE